MYNMNQLKRLSFKKLLTMAPGRIKVGAIDAAALGPFLK